MHADSFHMRSRMHGTHSELCDIACSGHAIWYLSMHACRLHASCEAALHAWRLYGTPWRCVQRVCRMALNHACRLSSLCKAKLHACMTPTWNSLALCAVGVPQGESSAGWSVQILSKFATQLNPDTSGLKDDSICAEEKQNGKQRLFLSRREGSSYPR